MNFRLASIGHADCSISGRLPAFCMPHPALLAFIVVVWTFACVISKGLPKMSVLNSVGTLSLFTICLCEFKCISMAFTSLHLSLRTASSDFASFYLQNLINIGRPQTWNHSLLGNNSAANCWGKRGSPSQS